MIIVGELKRRRGHLKVRPTAQLGQVDHVQSIEIELLAQTLRRVGAAAVHTTLEGMPRRNVTTMTRVVIHEPLQVCILDHLGVELVHPLERVL